MLAIKALLQDQKDAKRDEHHDRTKEIPWETTRHKVSNNTTRSPGSDVDKPDPPAILGINSQNQAPLDPRVSGLKLPRQGPESSAPICGVQSPKSPRGTTKDRKGPPSEHGPERVRYRGKVVRPDLPEPKLRMGIHVFLLKPVVENFFDKVELTWLLQNIPMRESAIYRYLNQQNYEGNDVFDMLHILHPYEKKILGGVMFGIDMSTEGSLLSLKRTETTICHRDITFRDVPGLQFVVRREDRIPDAVPPNIPEPPVSPPGWERPRTQRECRRRADSAGELRLASYDPSSYRIRDERARGRETMYPVESGAPSQSRQDDAVEDEEGWQYTRNISHHSRAHRLRAAIYMDEDRYSSPRSVGHASVSSDFEDQGYSDIEADQERMSLPEQDEDAVIDDMLKRYTTLFD